MQTCADFFNFLPYCCDANGYIGAGKLCAKTGECYNAFKPMGSSLWFSLPFRLGLSPSITLISIHLLLASISAILAVVAMHPFFSLCQRINCRKLYVTIVLLIVSAVIHGIFLYPTLQVPLTDAPASLFALMSIWLLLIKVNGHATYFLKVFVAGLCLGFAAWLRVAFLYPVLVLLLMWLIRWLIDKNRRLAEAGILIALLPIAIQFHATWERTGKISYLDPKTTKNLLQEHGNNKSIGYDTVLGKPWKWYADCVDYSSPIESVKTFDLHSLYCLLSGRVNFYLGSYSHQNFIMLNELDEPNIENSSHSKIRLWSHKLFIVNIFVFIIASALMVTAIKKQRHHSDLLVFVFLALICIQAIISHPEQRFIIAPMIVAWVFSLSWVITTLLSTTTMLRGK